MFSNIELLKANDVLSVRDKVHFSSLINSPTGISYYQSSPKYDEYQMHYFPLENNSLGRVYPQTQSYQSPVNNPNNIPSKYYPPNFQSSGFQPANFKPLNNRTRFISVPHQNGIRY